MSSPERESSSDFSTSRSESLVRGELSLFRLAGYVRSEAVIVSGVPGGTDSVNEGHGQVRHHPGLDPDGPLRGLYGDTARGVCLNFAVDATHLDHIDHTSRVEEGMGVVPSHPYRQARGDGSFMGPAGGTEAGSSSPVGQGGRVHGHVSRSRAMPCEVALLATAITSPLLSRNRKGSCSAGRGGLSRVGGKGGGGVWETGVSVSVRAVRSASHSLRAAGLFLCTTAGSADGSQGV
ncbi:unnamed protein product [Arctogadus glacialis]